MLDDEEYTDIGSAAGVVSERYDINATKDLPSEGDTRSCYYGDDSRFVVIIFMHLAELQARVMGKNEGWEGVGAAPSLAG